MTDYIDTSYHPTDAMIDAGAEQVRRARRTEALTAEAAAVYIFQAMLEQRKLAAKTDTPVLSVRDKIAIAALPAATVDVFPESAVVERAYSLADAMIKFRSNEAK